MMYTKILLLLWLTNFAPPLVAYFLENRWATPLDRGKYWKDHNRILGDHKTFRGIIAAIFTGILLGYLFNLGVWIGGGCATLTMLGDVCSSFIKRRRGMTSGQDAPGLDQIVEGVLPLLLLKYCLVISWGVLMVLLVVFSLGAYIGSRIYKRLVQKAHTAYAKYPRPLKPRLMAKEFAACHLQSKFLRSFIHFEDAIYYHLIIQSIFKMLGIYNRGVANALCFITKELTVELPSLPRNFDNYRILFMSDLHLDGLPGLSERLVTLLPEQKVDLCLLGGDYRMATHGNYKDCITRLGMVTRAISAKDGIVGVLGNHDCIEMTEALMSMGTTVLINDSFHVKRGDETLWIAGVDDPHYYQCANIKQAMEDIPEHACTIFLAHSPEIYNEVDAVADLFLAGHTHGGQIQIPPFGPIFTHCSAPRKMCHGTWHSGKMQGYTSNGVGVSGVPVRFNCPGEIVIITLKCPDRIPSREEK